jgi:hypothetical protein
MKNIEALAMPALVAIHNHLNPEKPATTKTFSQRSKAIERITRLAKEKGINLTKAYADDGQPIVVEKAKAAKPEAKVRGPVIRPVAEALLMQVVGKDDSGRPLGRSYADILEELHGKFPEAVTSVACLRWYAVKMRGKGGKVPNRPRAKPEAVVEAPAAAKA